MTITVGFVKSDTQINVADIDLDNQSVTQKVIDAIELKDINFQLLITNDSESMEELEDSFNSEKKFYPIVSNTQFSLNQDDFARMNYVDLVSLYNKINSRWIMTNNIKTIEQLYSVVNYFRDLWTNDRSSFFEELWFLLKTNLATTNLTMIYHDVDKNDDSEKSKPQLINVAISGEKIPNMANADDAQNQLMKDYAANFSEVFQVTEFIPQKGQLVATAHVNLSPILIMANLSEMNQLQNSLLISIFSGLQSEI